MTTTLADRIREKAESTGYWTLNSDWARRQMRKDLARWLGCPAANVYDALKRLPKRGRPRDPELTRCEKCGQPLAVAPHAAAAESTEPTP